MSKDLVIVESPAKARTITRILGDEYNVMASYGHIRDLPDKGLGVDVENGFKPTYKQNTDKRNVISNLTKAVAEAKHVYLAADPDREGEAIAWHLYEILKKKNKKAIFHRVTFHEITKSAVQASFDKPGEIDMDRVDAQQARRVLDRLVGFQVSPLLWQKVTRGTSAGRVQSAALRIICERQAEIDSFEPHEYWNLEADFKAETDPKSFTVKLARIDGEKADVPNAETAESTATDAQAADYRVTSVKRTPKKRRAQPPYITSTLQQSASASLRIGPAVTMRIAQQLYEGTSESDSDYGGLITYMRTDSFNVAKVAQDAARDFISEEYGEKFVPAKPNFYKTKGNAQEAHEAIRPTNVNLTPEKAAKFLDRDQSRLYELIWRRFVASQMADAQMSQYTVELENSANSAKHIYLFRATSTKLLFPGYRKVYDLKGVHEGQTEDEEERALPELVENTACQLLKLDKEQKFTEPPPQFSEAMLIKTLHQNGIGRPSTYAPTVKTVKDRKYVRNVKGKLDPTDLGKTVNDYLVNNLDNLFQIDFTAKMETQLDSVEAGKMNWVDMLTHFYGDFREWLVAAGASSGTPKEAVIAELVQLVQNSVTEWAEPEKRGRRTYDDKKFVESILKQMEDGKNLSDRQWNAVLRLASKYAEQIPTFDEVVQRLELAKDLEPLIEKAKAAANAEPDAAALKIFELLVKIKEWEAPEGKRRGDEKFFKSLKEQAERTALSEKQTAALKNLTKKYSEQIPGYEGLVEEYGLLPMPTVDSESKVARMLELANDVTTWEEPVKRGRRSYDDSAFVESLQKQFKQKGQLSDRQVNAYTKVIAKYASQIENFESRVKEIGVEISATKKVAEETDVDCPKCGDAKLIKRSGRKGIFYGCGAFPKCRFLANSLDDLSKSNVE
jgi:DNA topoisomerase-1